MTIGSASTPRLPPLSSPLPHASPKPADGNDDRSPEASRVQAAEPGSELPFDPARGRNVNITL